MPTHRALLIIDIQYDFLPPNGSLAVTDGQAVVPFTLDLLEGKKHEAYDLIVASLDWHPPAHISFASKHGKDPFQTIEVDKLHAPGEHIAQMLWPDHCLEDSHGSTIEASLKKRLDGLGHKVKYVKKGHNLLVDSYSAFADNAYTLFTPLSQILHEKHIKAVDVVGLALDYCVRHTAIDARKFGLETRVLRKGTRGVNVGKEAETVEELRGWGCEVVE